MPILNQLLALFGLKVVTLQHEAETGFLVRKAWESKEIRKEFYEFADGI